MMLRRFAIATVVAVLGTVITTAPASAAAETVTIDGVTYSADSSDVVAGATVISAPKPPTELVIPDSVLIGTLDFVVSSIAPAAFQGAPVESAVIPAGVASIGDGAFRGSALASVTFVGDAPVVEGEFALGDADTVVRHLRSAAGFTAVWSGGGATEYATAPLERVVQVAMVADRSAGSTAGATLQVSGSGFVPNESVALQLPWSGQSPTSVAASRTGGIDVAVVVSPQTSSGAYELVVTGSISGESRHPMMIAAATAPTEPLNLRVTVNDGLALTLEWAPPASNGGNPVIDYVIQYKRSTTSTWTTQAESVNAARTFTFPTPPPAVTFNFRVQAVTTDGAGPFSGVATATVPLATVTQFTPGFIIADQNFYDGDAMTESQIQSFLNARIGTCLSDDCLNVLRVDLPTYPAAYSTSTGRLVCATVAGGSGLRASTVIFRVQEACGISAKVIQIGRAHV